MSDTAASPDAGALPADSQPSAPMEMPESFSSPSEAARFLGKHAAEKRKQAQGQSQEAPVEAPEQEEAPQQELTEATPAVEAEAPAEEAETLEAETPIDPPRSWPKEDKDFFSSLPRQAQERIVQREAERDRLTLRGSNELSDQRKAVEAKAQELGQLRQQYESQLPLVVQTIQAVIASEFSDIKTADDVQKLAANDPARYIQWDAKQKQLAQWNVEAQQAHQRQQQESSERLNNWIKSQDDEIEKLFEKTPKTERDALANEAKAALLEYGFNDEQINGLWGSSVLRSAPMQRIMADAARYRIAKKTATKHAAKPVPPVQKPGTVTPGRSTADQAEIARLEGKDSLTFKEASRLLDLKTKQRAA